MQARIQKWGNSLALRLPKIVADELGIVEHGVVTLRLENGTLTIHPVHDAPLTLEHLLSGITNENMHSEYVTGDAQGQEVW